MDQVQSTHDEVRCSFADHKTMQIRPATTYGLSDESRICLSDLRDAPNCEFEAIRQHVRNMNPYKLTVQYKDDNSNDETILVLCEQQANKGGYFLLNFRSCSKEQDPTWDISLGFCTNLHGLIRSFAEIGEDLHVHVRKTSCGSCIGIHHRTIPADWICATVGRHFLHHVNTVYWNTQKLTARNLSESIRSYRRICARHSKQKLH